MIVELNNVISIGQLLALLGVVFRAGQIVQRLDDHIGEDSRRFADHSSRLNTLEGKQA